MFSVFSMFESLAKASLGVLTVPVALVADVVTLSSRTLSGTTIGGACTDKEEPYTSEAVSDLVRNLKNATDPFK